MKKLIFILALLIFALIASCANFSKIGTRIEFDGGTAFCVHDETGDTTSETTCSFTIKHNEVIYQCDKISLKKLNKDFKLETNCTVILDLRTKDNRIKNDTHNRNSYFAVEPHRRC
ncbi:MAG: hypothetical protein ACOX2F_07320 [bacterium]